MKYLSRNDLETIGGRVIAAYKRLSAISGQALERVDIDYLCQELLGLRIDYARLSLNGEKIGLTSSCDIGVEVFPEDPSSTEEQYYMLDGKTILIESDLMKEGANIGRRNYTVSHESCHHILKMLFPHDYGAQASGRSVHCCYRSNRGNEESKSPDRIAKIKADLASKGKDGYSIAITYDASPTPPTWDTFANSLLCLDGRLEMWKLMQESWPHHKAVEAQKGVSKMSTSYFIFTEVLTNDQWHCINPQVMKLLPIEQLILVPTLRSDSRYQFEKAYRQLECDGHPFTVDEMSRNLQASVNDWLTPEDSVRIAVCYDDILKLLNTSGKEHSAFALRSEVAAFQNGESDNILDFVSVDEYRKMEDELKKAYQYFEWNDRSGAYRYYEEIQKKVAAQVKDWKAINPRAEITSVRILLFST